MVKKYVLTVVVEEAKGGVWDDESQAKLMLEDWLQDWCEGSFEEDQDFTITVGVIPDEVVVPVRDVTTTQLQNIASYRRLSVVEVAADLLADAAQECTLNIEEELGIFKVQGDDYPSEEELNTMPLPWFIYTGKGFTGHSTLT